MIPSSASSQLVRPSVSEGSRSETTRTPPPSSAPRGCAGWLARIETEALEPERQFAAFEAAYLDQLVRRICAIGL